MRNPSELFELAADLPAAERPVLVQALTGFVDAGNAGRLAREHLIAVGNPRVVATFDLDQLYDYRGRRPPMLFVEDHWEHYEQPTLVLRALDDAEGTTFLMLDGPEPDVQWERFVAAVEQLCRRLDVRVSVGFNSIPMAVPHTRPLGVTAHASRRELISDYQPWLQRVQVPGSAVHLLEYRLGSAGRDSMGFSVHVPHYLAQTDYPAAAQTLLEAVSRATGLELVGESLTVAAAEVRADVDGQVERSEEVASVVRALEEQYDAYVAGRGENLLASDTGPLPTADELGAELERFLAEQTDRPDQQ